MGDKVIVYRSRREQLLDEWLYDQGGMAYVAGFLAVAVVVLLIGNAVANRRRFR